MRRAVGEADLGEQASARWRDSDSATRRSGASLASTFSSAVSVGIRLNCWKTKPNERRRSSASSPSRKLGEVAALEEDVAARPVERAEQLEQRRLAGAARALERDELARLDRQVDALERVDRRVGRGWNDLADAAAARTGSSRPSSARRRGGGVRRAVRRPRRRAGRRGAASPKPASRIGDADRRCERDRVRGACGRPARGRRGSPPPVVELAVSVGPNAPTRSGDADAEHDAERCRRGRPSRATRPRSGGRPAAASSRAPSASRARARACRPTRARAARRAGTRRRRRRSRARGRGCARGSRRRRASR